MKKRLNKALALLIAVMLVIGIMPTAFAGGGEEISAADIKVVYSMQLSSVAAGDSMEEIAFSDTNEFWAFEEKSSANFKRDKNNGSQTATTVLGSWWAIRLNVPAKGKYDIKLNRTVTTDGDKAYIYFGKGNKEINEIISTGYVCDTTFYASSTSRAISDVLGTVTAEEAGEYIMVFRFPNEEEGSANTKTTKKHYVKEIILQGNDNSVAGVVGKVVVGENNTITKGNTAPISAIAYDTINGTAVDTTSLIVETSNPSVLFVNADGSVTGKGVGTAKITVSKDGWANSIETTVDVVPNRSGVRVVYSTELSNISGGSSMKEVSFADSNGFWAFEEQNADFVINRDNNNGMQIQPNATYWWAARLYIPVAGEYDLKFNRTITSNGGVAMLYFGKGDASDIVKTESIGDISFYAESTERGESEKVATVDVETAGEYILVLRCPSTAEIEANGWPSSRRQYFKEIILDGCTGDEKTYAPMLNVSATPDTITVGETATVTATSTLMSDGINEANAEISYATNGIVSIDGTTVTGVSDGVATVTATATVGDVSSSRSVNITVNNKAISDGFNAKDEVETYAPSVTAYTYKDGQSAVLENTETDTYITNNGDGTYNLVAPDDEGTYEFLYWVKGLETKKRVISTSRSFTYRATKDNSHLIAVYENTADVTEAKAEFYNANMQLIESNNTGKVPELPVLARYGEAIAWVAQDGTEYTSGTAELRESGTTMFIAKYKDEEELEPISITATNATVSNANPAYGEKITVTANADTEGSVFQYFTKNGEVVCLDRTYSYNAYKSETVVAVYGTKKPTYIGNKRKIFLDVFDVTTSEKGLMAEFIGFENDIVVEKGIMLGTRKMPMTTTNTQFTIIADENGTYTGYAIIKDGESFLIITDGEYKK